MFINVKKHACKFIVKPVYNGQSSKGARNGVY